ncbi:hypothetical protein N7495_000760 [Penicillium taxi]|uniref:uncharacterized protein n=1 Tax=Penicillium taxi TaxID=168475 RepID=UPI0025459A17|nr:uncharacterized protein N7495_000760 [Penicillium taxi]KAJ5908078.1 hypothetical protein N7495_000760 [Penicillium taxi]
MRNKVMGKNQLVTDVRERALPVTGRLFHRDFAMDLVLVPGMISQMTSLGSLSDMVCETFTPLIYFAGNIPSNGILSAYGISIDGY